MWAWGYGRSPGAARLASAPHTSICSGPKLPRFRGRSDRSGMMTDLRPRYSADHHQVRSTILTSQLPVSRWHEQVGDPALADGILGRLVHNAHRIEMRGDSMRKNRSKANA